MSKHIANTKILMIMTSKFQRSGITAVVVNVLKELFKYEDVAIDLVVPNGSDEQLMSETRKLGAKVFEMSGKSRIFITPLYIYRLSRIIRKGKYDVVHIHGSSTLLYLELLAAKIGGVEKRIVHSHNTATSHRIAHRILRKKFDRAYTSAVACSEDAGRWLFGNKDFTTIQNGIEIDKYLYNSHKRKEIRDKYSIEEDDIVVGHVGLFNQQKNQEYLVDVLEKALTDCKNIKLLLIGKGETEKSIKENVREKGLGCNVIFAGEVYDVGSYYSAMDVFVMPSRFEGFGLAALEAQISGLPCILSDKIPDETIVSNKVCRLGIKEENVPEWADMIKKETRRTRGIKRELFNKYDIRNTAKEYLAIYRERDDEN